jgi:hypothetical protein
MKRSAMLVACLLATLGRWALAQSTSGSQSSASAVAYVYVSSPNPTSYGTIYAYSARSNGQLTLVSTEPSYASYMALNGGWLFGTDGTNIYSFYIAPDGTLSQTSAINATQLNPYNSGGPGNLFLDHTGSTLYDGDTYAYGTGDNAYQTFTIDQATGQLNFLALTSDGGTEVGSVLSFTAGNKYAYSSSCYHFTPAIFGYLRNSDHTLAPLNINPPIPTAPNGGYCPYLAAADPTNHLAIALTPYNDFSQTGPTQFAAYTQDNSGNLSTTSTSANMPQVHVGNLNDYWMSPSGKLLAVAGTAGLQVLHFNGGNPLTRYTGLLTRTGIDQVFWDNNNHLYAISRSAGKLYVFTVTPTTHSQSLGSPYTIPNPQNLIVLPK